jgi:Protein of unknown function (DUF4019)
MIDRRWVIDPRRSPMFRIAGRPSPPQPIWMLIVALVVASNAVGNPPDDPKPKSSSKKTTASKSTSKSKDADKKADDSKPKTEDDKKIEEKAKKKDAALKVAETYLVLLDKGKFGESWDSMTPHVKKGITRRKWMDSLGKSRAPYGDLQARKLRKVEMRATEVADKYDEAWVYADFQTLDGQVASELLIVVLLNGKDWTVNTYWVGDPATFPKPPVLEEEPATKSAAK